MPLIRPPSWLTRFASPTFKPPFDAPLPSNAEAYLQQASLWQVAWRRARRMLWLWLNGQGGLERRHIEPSHRRILWIHSGMPQVGDVLMDMACRTLLDRHRHQVDLLLPGHLAPLFEHDPLFHRVYSDAGEAAANGYDLVLLLTASSRSLGQKFKHFRRLPFVHIQGFYNGPEFHRTLFGFHRLAQLLRSPLTPAQLLARAVPTATVSDEVRRRVDALALPARFIAVALGGVVPWRTHGRWDAVLDGLEGLGCPVVLVGSANGRAMRDQVLSRPRGFAVIDQVDCRSLPETFEILRRSTLAACADGGLLHLAHAAGVPTVSLFAERIQPSYRLTPANRSVPLYHPVAVDAIEPALVAQAIASAWHAQAQPSNGAR